MVAAVKCVSNKKGPDVTHTMNTNRLQRMNHSSVHMADQCLCQTSNRKKSFSIITALEALTLSWPQRQYLSEWWGDHVRERKLRPLRSSGRAAVQKRPQHAKMGDHTWPERGAGIKNLVPQESSSTRAERARSTGGACLLFSWPESQWRWTGHLPLGL